MSFLLPDLDGDTTPFWEATARHQLVVQRCDGCGRLRFPPRPLCPWCNSFESSWPAMSGRATIWSFVVPHPPLLPAYAELAPYNVIVVTLEEDPTIRMVGNLVSAPDAAINSVDPTTIEIGAPVEVVFQEAEEGVVFPVGATLTIRPLVDDDRAWLRDDIESYWGLPVVSISGAHHDPWSLPGFVAEVDGAPAGHVTFIVDGDSCEVFTLHALEPGRGTGRALLSAARDAAAAAGCRRLWLMTTNENIDGIRFYQRWGMDLVALHRNFADTVRAIKPAIAHDRRDGIPFRHALEFELVLDQP